MLNRLVRDVAVTLERGLYQAFGRLAASDAGPSDTGPGEVIDPLVSSGDHPPWPLAMVAPDSAGVPGESA